ELVADAVDVQADGDGGGHDQRPPERWMAAASAWRAKCCASFLLNSAEPWTSDGGLVAGARGAAGPRRPAAGRRSPASRAPAGRRASAERKSGAHTPARPVEGDERGHAHEGEVAGAARHLDERAAGARRRGGDADLREHLARPERGGERADEELAGRNDATPR